MERERGCLLEENVQTRDLVPFMFHVCFWEGGYVLAVYPIVFLWVAFVWYRTPS